MQSDLEALGVSSRRGRNTQRRVHRARAHALDDVDQLYAETEEDYGLPTGRLLWSIVGGLVLLYPCIAMAQLCGSWIGSQELLGNMRESQLNFCFLVGVVLSFALLAVPLTRTLLLPLYVIGHEVTHAIFVFVCYGKVSDFRASAGGGYIIANRANILVSLSPYVVPFWTLVLALGHALLAIVVDLTVALPYLTALYGATWFFNLFWTVWMIPLGQTDLSANGTFFSLTLIFLANITVLSLLLEFMRPTPSVEAWFYAVMNAHNGLWYQLTSLLGGG